MRELTQAQVEAASAAEQAEMERAQVQHLSNRVVQLRAALDSALVELEELRVHHQQDPSPTA